MQKKIFENRKEIVSIIASITMNLSSLMSCKFLLYGRNVQFGLVACDFVAIFGLRCYFAVEYSQNCASAMLESASEKQREPRSERERATTHLYINCESIEKSLYVVRSAKVNLVATFNPFPPSGRTIDHWLLNSRQVSWEMISPASPANMLVWASLNTRYF